MVVEPVDELLVLGPDAPASRGFSPPAKTDSKSSRLSMSGLALSSVVVVIGWRLAARNNPRQQFRLCVNQAASRRRRP